MKGYSIFFMQGNVILVAFSNVSKSFAKSILLCCGFDSIIDVEIVFPEGRSVRLDSAKRAFLVLTGLE